MPSSLLQVRGVSWRASQVPILERVSFELAAGEFVGLLGRNGAGKSTLLDLVAGLRVATEGSIVLMGRGIDEWSAVERARLLAHLPQLVRADLAIDAEALVLMGRYAHAGGWFETEADRAFAREAMRRCDCFEFRHRALGTLSGGERQRVFLAACLVQQAPLLLLDEPASFLDVDQQLQCFSMLKSEADRGAACLAVTHDINLALTFCTRLIVLANRGVACDISSDTALDHPDWLRLFSDRLHVDEGRGAQPWVRYQ